MNLRRSLVPVAIMVAALGLSGCSAGTAEEQQQAYEECQLKLTPQFADPDLVTWPEDGYGFSGSGDTREIVAVVEDGDKRTRVSCILTATDDGWVVEMYDFSEPKDEVVN